ncbi:DNA-directed RNA polymerase I subunit RPA1 [Hypsibius exemplaris]|uniref:DNA-directed RNA polymerase subunit n=1 Tax=Hypsibius exemplaris TaxID=2072580 RepID=A0A1W0WSU3_HYPEX|nr:DNA-directed RNA polymerase I subunit RPA1 [Hypsibius exemplaris]
MDFARRPVSHHIKEVSFEVYPSEEAKALSLVSITNPQCLDLLGLPIVNGVQDTRMGVTERGSTCPVCYQPSRGCPGHMGHVVLPVPIFNPMLFRTTLQILKGSCFQCKALLIDPLKIPIFLRQMHALDCGSMAVALLIPEYAQSFTADPTSRPTDLEGKLDAVIESLLGKPGTETSVESTQTREERKKILSAFMHYSWKKNRSCLVCKDKNWRLSANPYGNKVMYRFGAPSKEKKLATKPKSTKYSSFSSGRGKAKKGRQPEVQNMEEKPPEEGPTNEPEEEKVEDITNDPRAIRFPAIEARTFLREVYAKNADVLRRCFGLLGHTNFEHPTDVFFLDTLLVPPNRFRPERVLMDSRFAHVQTKNIERIVGACNNIRIIRRLMQEGKTDQEMAKFTNLLKVPGKTLELKFYEAVALLQTAVNAIVDGETDRLNPEFAQGIKQLLEKKEGKIRSNMMGKRVNFCARTVISPDPYINLNEIGIPMVFAKKLTYPTVVSPNNLEEMKRAVLNGPDNYPGAIAVEMEDGLIVKLSAENANQRANAAKGLISSSRPDGRLKKVHRHLINGDMLLLNRQPTLHKTSIMAHKARVLTGEKTFRLHYANCKSYNADFDGDEMNAHFPQDEVSRSEANNIVNASYQYLVAKDGTPLSGLIQDHIVAGVHLTIRGKFFEKSDYEQLVYSAIGDIVSGCIAFLPPTIIKPQRLWSGKQIISTIVLNLIPKGFSPLSLRTASKVPLKSWWRTKPKAARRAKFLIPLPDEKDMTESDVIFRKGELLCGVLDKAQYGNSSYGLVHACYELYGGDISALLLSGLARLFTLFLQIHGFSLGVEDILVSESANAKRRAIMETVEEAGKEAACEAFNLPSDITPESLRDRIEKAHRSTDQSGMQILDGITERRVTKFNNDITNACMPYGLYKAFPENHLQTMVVSGAKGAQVNCIQMSCLLGQITLEGTRPPLMLSGRTLPSFVAYEATPRSGGFVMQRFGTGLRPQEYFFHCMAGREGLIDTAVKTSRSGYLQRCIIKHLEGVMVNYDLTVRDSDASVIQFLYGEDGLDIGRLPFYTEKQLPFLMANSNEEVESEIRLLKSAIGTSLAEEHENKVASWRRKLAKDEEKRAALLEKDTWKTRKPSEYILLPDGKPKRIDNGKLSRTRRVVEPTISACRPDLHFGSVSEQMRAVMEKYLAKPPLKNCIVDSVPYRHGKPVDEIIHELISYKYVKSLCQPGEAVGALAAQSIGEPSTQMTLNTFHFAGRGEMNVTLGIPRLREILMTASKVIKTPTMEVPVRPGMEAEAEALRVRLNKVMFSEVVEYFDVRTKLEVQEDEEVSNQLELFIKLLPSAHITSKTCLTSAKIVSYFEKTLTARLIDAIKTTISVKKLVKAGKRGKKTGGDREDDESIDVNAVEGVDDNLGESGGGEEKAGEVDNDDDSVNSDGEDADPDAAKAQFAADGEYAGDQDDEDIEHEFDREQAALAEGDELLEEDKENSLMGDISNSEAGDSPDLLLSAIKSGKKRIDKVKTKKVMNPLRQEYVCGLDKWIMEYSYDAEDESWCRVTIAIPISNSVLDPQSLIETELKRAVVYQAPSIKKSFLTRDKAGVLLLQTEGVNFDYLLRYDRVLEVDKLFSNDIQAVAGRFGIEAAARTVIRECVRVFGAYGIDVNYRHLSLIADYMSQNGSIRAFNRMALTTNASPFQKMSFETSMNFYRDAVISGTPDTIKSPSAQLVVGERLNIGTGLFSLRQPVSLR